MPKRSPPGAGTLGARPPSIHPAPPELPPRRWVNGLLALAMLLWLLAYTPRPFVLATVPGVVAWLWLVERCRRFREVLFWTAVFGAVGTAFGYRWLAQTAQDFGRMDPARAWLSTALFGIWNTAHAWILAAFYRGLLMRGRRPHPLLTVVLFVGCETLPIRLFAWTSGHGAVDVPPLLQSAEWGGVPGVSFALLCLVVPIHEWLHWSFGRRGAPARPRAALVTFLIGVALFAWGTWRYDEVRREDEAAARSLRVAIVQPNVGSQAKRKATETGGSSKVAAIAAYRRGTQKAVTAGAELVVWPESAITDSVPLKDTLQTNQFLRGQGYGFLNEWGQDRLFLVGMYEEAPPRISYQTGEKKDRRYNVAALRRPGDAYAEWSVYRKVFLIPFGEMTPGGNWDHLLPHKFKMLPGEMPQDLLTYQDLTFAPFICYEGILPGHVRAVVGETRPDLLVSLTNDSWFGDSWEPYQHLHFTRFRAVEHRVPLVRATNTGISAFVSATGDIEGFIPLDAEDTLVRQVPLVEREPTIFVRFGHHLPLVCWILALFGWIVAVARPPARGFEDPRYL